LTPEDGREETEFGELLGGFPRMVDCWSSVRAQQDVETLPVVRAVYREFASLGGGSGGIGRPFPLPEKLLIHGKATFRRTNAFMEGGFDPQAFETELVDSRLPEEDSFIDSAWFTLAKHPNATATISVLATVDAPAPGGDPLTPHIISWIVNPGGVTFDIHRAWLVAIPLESLHHQG
jgi:hypothetical protein